MNAATEPDPFGVDPVVWCAQARACVVVRKVFLVVLRAGEAWGGGGGKGQPREPRAGVEGRWEGCGLGLEEVLNACRPTAL